jgi:predicted Zn-dependent peptidase
MLDRSIAPPFKKIEKIDIQKAQTVMLDNGVPVHLIKAGQQPVIKLEIILQSGKWFEQQEGLAFFTAKMISEGTPKKTAHQISTIIDQYGAYLEVSPGYDYISIAFYSLEKYLKLLVPLFEELLFSASFPDTELEIMKNMVRQEIKIKQEKSNIVALKNFREILFREHPYGKDLDTDHIDDIHQEQLQHYYDNYFRNKPEIVISGSFSQDEILQLVNDHFGSKSYPQLSLIDYQINYEPENTVIEKPRSSQSSIKIGKVLFNKTHPEYLKMLFVNEVLGGYFGSRLMKNIREEKGYTYGIYSRMMNFRAAGYFIISADVKKESTRLAIEEIYKEILKLQESLVPDAELEIVKNQMLGSFLNEINSPFALAEKFKSVHYHNLDYSFYQHFIETINQISAEEVRQVAQRHLQRNSMSEVVVGGMQ